MLNGADGHRPDLGEQNAGHNIGVGFRFFTFPINDNATWAQAGFNYDKWELSDDNGDNFLPIELFDSLEGIDNSYSNSTIFISLDRDLDYPPLDSRWVDKITIESSAQLPGNWTTAL
jgi:hypothetical protein